MCSFRKEEFWTEEMDLIVNQNPNAFSIVNPEIGKRIPNNYSYYSCIVAGQVVGFGSVYTEYDNEISIVVNNTDQGHSYGTEILHYLEETVNGIKLVAIVDQSNSEKSRVENWLIHQGYAHIETSRSGSKIFMKQ